MKLKNLTIATLLVCVGFVAAPSAQALLGLPGLGDDLLNKIEDFQLLQEELQEKRAELTGALREMDPADRRAAIEAFQEANAELIAAHRALGEEIRDEMREIHSGHERDLPERVDLGDRPLAERPERPSSVRDFMADFQERREELLQRLRDASEEDREQALANFQQERADLIAQLREAARGAQDSVDDFRESRRNNR